MAGNGIRIVIGVVLVGVVVVAGLVLAPNTPSPPASGTESNGPNTPETSGEAPESVEPVAARAPKREPFEPGVLLVGDPAPAIEASNWYRGEAVSHLEPGSVYVVDFWATWCGPCVRAMPHLSELQNTYKQEGLRVIAVSIDTGESANAQVAKFVERRSDDITFDVALDSGQTKVNWLDASGRDSIPSTYVVDREGTVVWMGNPTTPEGEFDEPVIDRVLREVMSDSYDTERAIASARATVLEARAVRQRAERVEQLTNEMGTLWSGGDIEGALELVDEIISLDPVNNSELALRKAEVLLYERNDLEAASAFFVAMLEGPYFDDNETLLGLANLFTGDVDPGEAGREAAITAAELVVSREPHPESILTLARAQFAAGLQDEAVKNAIWARDFFDYGSGEYEFFDRYVQMYEQTD